MDDQRERELYAAMRSAREAYSRISAEFDSLLIQAHGLDHGGPLMVDALSRANSLAPELQAALKRYFDAVKRLSEFYRAGHAGDLRKPGGASTPQS
jgi:hypothetical protein